jgi:hypothetical protein
MAVYAERRLAHLDRENERWYNSRELRPKRKKRRARPR